MSQAEIFVWLKKKYQLGEKIYWTPKQINHALGLNIRSTNDKLGSLYRAGFLEIEQEGLWKRKYRIKEKYTK